MSIRDRLVNWSFAITGYVGPEVPSECASAERHYLSELGHVWEESEQDDFSPDILDAQVVEREVCALKEDLRSVIKAKYISYPYESDYFCAHRLRMQPKKFKERLDDAHARLSKKLGE